MFETICQTTFTPVKTLPISSNAEESCRFRQKSEKKLPRILVKLYESCGGVPVRCSKELSIPMRGVGTWTSTALWPFEWVIEVEVIG